LVNILGRRGGVVEVCWVVGGEGFFNVVAGKGEDDMVEVIGGAGVGGALEVGGTELGLGFADHSKGRPKGDAEDCVDLGVNRGALGLSAGVVEGIAS